MRFRYVTLLKTIKLHHLDDEDDGPEVEDNDPAEVRPTTTQTDKPSDSNTVNMRSYDLYITYDRYYQVRRRIVN